ncbi:MAG: hypothetical protein ABIG73_00105 [Patescibacteria group bacterium]
MNDFLNKLTSYNLFNYLLPGILFAVIADEFMSFHFIQENIIIGVFVYYFIGLVISRFGSLVIEPLLRKILYLKFSSYPEFVCASKEDPKIEILLEANNMYRTFCSLFSLLLLLKFYSAIEYKFPVLGTYSPYILTIILLIIFLCAYWKQTKYITRRIEARNKKV